LRKVEFGCIVIVKVPLFGKQSGVSCHDQTY
jgi:hypothetical protein